MERVFLNLGTTAAVEQIARGYRIQDKGASWSQFMQRYNNNFMKLFLFPQLKHNARLCITCDIGLYPMHVAAQNSSSATLEVLIEYGKTVFRTALSGAEHVALN